MQHGARQRNETGLSMQDLQDGARLGNALLITSNEQVSGSNPLVGSPKGAVLQVIREVRQRVEPRFTATQLVPVIGWHSRVRPRRPRNFLTGSTLILFGLVVALGGSYPRWTGWMAVASGCAFAYNGVVEVAYEGFVPSIVKLLGLVLLAVWAFVMAFLMWREGGRRLSSGPESARSGLAHPLQPHSRTAVRRSG